MGTKKGEGRLENHMHKREGSFSTLSETGGGSTVGRNGSNVDLRL